jgi:hypothetical protein
MHVIRGLVSSSVFFKKCEHKTVILFVVWYECEAWLLVKMIVENTAMRIFGSKSEKETD